MAKKKRKLTAAQLAGLAKGRKKAAANRKKAKSSSKPKKRKTATAAKPKRRSTKKTTRKTVSKKGASSMARKKRRAPVAKKTRSRRRGSSRRFGGGGMKGIVGTVKEAGVAIGGGIAAGILSNKLPVADPRIKALAPAVAGIIMAATIGRKNKLAAQMALGMITLSGVSFIRQQFPNVPLLAGEEELVYLPDMTGENIPLGQEYDDDMSGIVNLGQDEMPYVTPASII